MTQQIKNVEKLRITIINHTFIKLQNDIKIGLELINQTQIDGFHERNKYELGLEARLVRKYKDCHYYSFDEANQILNEIKAKDKFTLVEVDSFIARLEKLMKRVSTQKVFRNILRQLKEIKLILEHSAQETLQLLSNIITII